MTETVAIITAQKAGDLKTQYPDLEIVQDCNDNNFIHIEEAQNLVGANGYAEIEFPIDGDFELIGSPRPRKRS